jgi:Protein of unknown function (DUF3313)
MVDGYRADSLGEAVTMKLSTRSRRNDGGGRATLYSIPRLRRSNSGRRIAGLVVVLAVAACSNASQRPAPTDVLGPIPLAPSGPNDVPNSLVYRSPDLDSKPAPRCFYIPATQIATGKEARFLEVTEQQKQIVADAVTDAFRHAIGQHQRVSTTSAPDCATLQLYLTGVTRSTPDQSVEGGAYGNFLGMTDTQGRNMQASVNGTITVAGKFTAPDGSVLAGFVDRVGTNAFDIPRDATPRQIAMLAAAHLASDLASAVDREVAVQRHNQGR